MICIFGVKFFFLVIFLLALFLSFLGYGKYLFFFLVFISEVIDSWVNVLLCNFVLCIVKYLVLFVLNF